MPHAKTKSSHAATKDLHAAMKIRDPPGFPGGSVVKNLPANSGDMGLFLDLGRSCMPCSN